MYTFHIVTNIKHYTGEYVEYERESYRQEWRVDKEKPDFVDRYIKALTQIGANPKRVSFKKCKYSL